MSIADKITGRIKQIAGGLTKDPEVRREGVREERKGQAKEEEFEAEQAAERKRQEVEDLERRT
jgi:uncharacterized protein YjbJ (UPF0337 family)